MSCDSLPIMIKISPKIYFNTFFEIAYEIEKYM